MVVGGDQRWIVKGKTGLMDGGGVSSGAHFTTLKVRDGRTQCKSYFFFALKTVVEPSVI